uniref:Uncharacterized protein n=1 Tax=Anopheles melas TaxID=34690 RepID=A0A182TRP8_9DIPT
MVKNGPLVSAMRVMMMALTISCLLLSNKAGLLLEPSRSAMIAAIEKSVAPLAADRAAAAATAAAAAVLGTVPDPIPGGPTAGPSPPAVPWVSSSIRLAVRLCGWCCSRAAGEWARARPLLATCDPPSPRRRAALLASLAVRSLARSPWGARSPWTVWEVLRWSDDEDDGTAQQGKTLAPPQAATTARFNACVPDGMMMGSALLSNEFSE